MPARLIRAFSDFLFNEKCLNCNRLLYAGERVLCLNCQTELTFKTEFPDTRLQRLFALHFPLGITFSQLEFEKGEVAQTLFHELKYKNQERIGKYLAEFLVKRFNSSLRKSSIDAITTIPLHKSKLNSRGYNQVDLWAKTISKSIEVPFLPKLLIRQKKTATQARQNQQEREANVRSAFSFNQLSTMPKHVLLLDDIITTGSTITSAAQTLIKGGVLQVSIGCMAHRV